MAERKPKGYIGKNHETIGTDILAVVRAVTMPEQIFGAELAKKLAATEPTAWYAIDRLLDPVELLGQKVGRLPLRAVGRKLFELSHAERLKSVATTAADLVYGLDGLYHAANRGHDIGGWKVVTFQPGMAVLEKTTPHHCIMEEGIIDQAFRTLEIPCIIKQTACFREGAEACTFAVSSMCKDERWMGGRPPFTEVD